MAINFDRDEYLRALLDIQRLLIERTYDVYRRADKSGRERVSDEVITGYVGGRSYLFLFPRCVFLFSHVEEKIILTVLFLKIPSSLFHSSARVRRGGGAGTWRVHSVCYNLLQSVVSNRRSSTESCVGENVIYSKWSGGSGYRTRWLRVAELLVILQSRSASLTRREQSKASRDRWHHVEISSNAAFASRSFAPRSRVGDCFVGGDVGERLLLNCSFSHVRRVTLLTIQWHGIIPVILFITLGVSYVTSLEHSASFLHREEKASIE